MKTKDTLLLMLFILVAPGLSDEAYIIVYWVLLTIVALISVLELVLYMLKRKLDRVRNESET